MMTKDENKTVNTRRIVVMDDEENPQLLAQQTPEVPKIEIERVNRGGHHIARYFWATVAILLIILIGVFLYRYYFCLGMEVSVSPSQNIEKLENATTSETQSGIVISEENVLGVAMRLLELKNVHAEMTLVEPDPADSTVLLYNRTADYTPEGRYLGSVVIDGQVLRSDVSRLGYCAVVDGNMVIGISRFDRLKDYAEEHKGGYFRQFPLVSAGELPDRFRLHGKVERKALARMAGDRLFVVETLHRESLWDFADALREYGFIDAIYLTGGNESGFYRAADGTPYLSEKAAEYRTNKHHGIAPWLVIKKK